MANERVLCIQFRYLAHPVFVSFSLDFDKAGFPDGFLKLQELQEIDVQIAGIVGKIRQKTSKLQEISGLLHF